MFDIYGRTKANRRIQRGFCASRDAGIPAQRQAATNNAISPAGRGRESGRQTSCTSTNPPPTIGSSRTIETTAPLSATLEQLTLSRADIPQVTIQASGNCRARSLFCPEVARTVGCTAELPESRIPSSRHGTAATVQPAKNGKTRALYSVRCLPKIVSSMSITSLFAGSIRRQMWFLCTKYGFYSVFTQNRTVIFTYICQP